MTELHLLSPTEVSKILGVTRSTLCRLRQEGKGPRFVWVIDHDYLNGETIRMDGALRMAPR